MKKVSTSKNKRPEATGNPLDTILEEMLAANSSMAVSQLKNILDTSFIKEQDGSYTPIMVTFNIPRGKISTRVEIPMITTLPITMLAFDKANIYLKDNNPGAGEGTAVDPAEEGYDADIQCEQQPLPQGLATLIAALTNSIQPEA